jgi:hypothetical protein
VASHFGEGVTAKAISGRFERARKDPAFNLANPLSSDSAPYDASAMFNPPQTPQKRKTSVKRIKKQVMTSDESDDEGMMVDNGGSGPGGTDDEDDLHVQDDFSDELCDAAGMTLASIKKEKGSSNKVFSGRVSKYPSPSKLNGNSKVTDRLGTALMGRSTNGRGAKVHEIDDPNYSIFGGSDGQGGIVDGDMYIDSHEVSDEV